MIQQVWKNGGMQCKWRLKPLSFKFPVIGCHMVTSEHLALLRWYAHGLHTWWPWPAKVTTQKHWHQLPCFRSASHSRSLACWVGAYASSGPSSELPPFVLNDSTPTMTGVLLRQHSLSQLGYLHGVPWNLFEQFSLRCIFSPLSRPVSMYLFC